MAETEYQSSGNKTFDSQIEQLGLITQVIVGLTSISGFIISSACLTYIVFKLKLNYYMKIILGITVGVNLLSSMSNILFLTFSAINGFLTIFACRLHAYSTYPLLRLLFYAQAWQQKTTKILPLTYLRAYQKQQIFDVVESCGFTSKRKERK